MIIVQRSWEQNSAYDLLYFFSHRVILLPVLHPCFQWFFDHGETTRSRTLLGPGGSGLCG